MFLGAGPELKAGSNWLRPILKSKRVLATDGHGFTRRGTS
jgi:hypothetical protein